MTMRSQVRNRDENDDVLSARATRVGRLVAMPLALVLGVQTISWVVPKVWTRGETLSAGDLHHNFGSLETRFRIS